MHLRHRGGNDTGRVSSGRLDDGVAQCLGMQGNAPIKTRATVEPRYVNPRKHANGDQDKHGHDGKHDRETYPFLRWTWGQVREEELFLWNNGGCLEHRCDSSQRDAEVAFGR